MFLALSYGIMNVMCSRSSKTLFVSSKLKISILLTEFNAFLVTLVMRSWYMVNQDNTLRVDYFVFTSYLTA